jgi:hypothetical protein
MVRQQSLLVTLVLLVDCIPLPAVAKRRGRPWVYSHGLFLKALVIMIIRHLPKVHTSSIAWARCQPEGSSPPAGTCRAPCWCTNWCSCTDSSAVSPCVSASNQHCRRLDGL